RRPAVGRIRVEHYNNAEKQGAAAARSMLGSTAPYDYLHSFWSDQYEHKIEYVGHVAKWDEFVVRGSLEEAKLIGFYLVDGVVRAAVGLDRGGDPGLDLHSEMAGCARLVAARARPAPAVLADDRTDLWSLAGVSGLTVDDLRVAMTDHGWSRRLSCQFARGGGGVCALVSV